MDRSRSRTSLVYGERVLLMAFGLVLTAAGFGNPLTAAISLVGWFVFLAGLGVVELAMAVWYRAQRRTA